MTSKEPTDDGYILFPNNLDEKDDDVPTFELLIKKGMPVAVVLPNFAPVNSYHPPKGTFMIIKDSMIVPLSLFNTNWGSTVASISFTMEKKQKKDKLYYTLCGLSDSSHDVVSDINIGCDKTAKYCEEGSSVENGFCGIYVKKYSDKQSTNVRKRFILVVKTNTQDSRSLNEFIKTQRDLTMDSLYNSKQYNDMIENNINAAKDILSRMVFNIFKTVEIDGEMDPSISSWIERHSSFHHRDSREDSDTSSLTLKNGFPTRLRKITWDRVTINPEILIQYNILKRVNYNDKDGYLGYFNNCYDLNSIEGSASDQSDVKTILLLGPFNGIAEIDIGDRSNIIPLDQQINQASEKEEISQIRIVDSKRRHISLFPINTGKSYTKDERLIDTTSSSKGDHITWTNKTEFTINYKSIAHRYQPLDQEFLERLGKYASSLDAGDVTYYTPLATQISEEQ